MIKQFGLLFGILLLLAGCASHSVMMKEEQSFSAIPAEVDVQAVERKLIWNGALTIEVKSVSNAVEQAMAVVKQSGGYIEDKSFRKDEWASLKLRVPSEKLTGAMGDLDGLGEVTRRYLSSNDVTEEYIDVESRLNNKKILRDRLTQLLDQAVDVKDVLAIEKELNRVQSDIDSMEARIRSLDGKIDYATIDLDLNRKTVYGPVGFIFHWTGKLIGNLFIIQK